MSDYSGVNERGRVMRKTSWKALLIFGMLFSAAGFADDAKLQYASHWQLSHPVDAMTYSDDLSQPFANFDFQDSGALAHARRLRGLSLLTVAELGRSRLYFGVNAKGFVGLHFDASPRHGDKRYWEMIRAPYLRKKQLDSD